MVAEVGQPGIVRQQSRQRCRIARGRGLVHGVRHARRREAPAQSLTQIPGDPQMAPILGHLQQGEVAVQGIAMGEVRSGGDQQSHRLQVSLAHGEVQWRHVPVAGRNQRGISLQSVAQRVRIAGAGRRQHLPDLLATPAAAAVSSAAVKLVWPQQMGPFHSAAQCAEGNAGVTRKRRGRITAPAAHRIYRNRKPRYLVSQNRPAQVAPAATARVQVMAARPETTPNRRPRRTCAYGTNSAITGA